MDKNLDTEALSTVWKGDIFTIFSDHPKMKKDKCMVEIKDTSKEN